MSKHYSIEKIQEIAGGDEDFMAVVAQTFLDEIPPDLEALQEAVSNNNKELAYQFAHKMKPSTFNCYQQLDYNSSFLYDKLIVFCC